MSDETECPVCGHYELDDFVNGTLRCWNCGYRPEYDNSIMYRLRYWWRSV